MNRRIRAAVGIDVEENDPSVDDEDDEEQPAPLAAGFEGGAGQGRASSVAPAQRFNLTEEITGALAEKREQRRALGHAWRGG
jgi:hypothetical protein